MKIDAAEPGLTERLADCLSAGGVVIMPCDTIYGIVGPAPASQDRIRELKGINSGLRREVESLGSDPERVALEARRLGYFREDQRVVRFQGRTPPPGSYTLGALVRVRAPRERRDWPWKLAGIFLPLAAYTVWSFARKSRQAGPQQLNEDRRR